MLGLKHATGADVVVTFTGGPELGKAFKELTPSLQRRVIKKATAAGAQVLVSTAKRNLKAMLGKGSRLFSKDKHQRAGSLQRSIKKRYWSRPDRGLITYMVGPSWPKGAHGHLVEHGHRIVIPTRDGKKVYTARRTKPVPFMRRSLDEAGSAVQAAQVRKAKAEFEKIASKAAAKR